MAERRFDLFARGERRTLSVSELTRQLKGQLEGRFASIEVEGEVFNAKRNAASGHWWLTLRDEGASLRCVLFRSTAERSRATPRDGVRVVARGRISVYEPAGYYQLVIDSLAPVGAGALTLRFEELKKRLRDEGLFDERLKRPLPRIPRRVGLVTSASGAAIADFLHVLNRRWPGMPVLVAPARVQGDGAAGEICRGIARLGEIDDVDVIVIARGGGSIEDLWAFNEEALARAIRRSPVPVVSGVGHETDFTIADFAADVRAPTPSAAAELIVPVRDELVRQLAVHKRRLWNALRRHIDVRRHRLEAQRHSLSDPRRLIGERRIALDREFNRTERLVLEAVRTRRAELDRFGERLAAQHPRRKVAEARARLIASEALARRLVTERLRDESARLGSALLLLERHDPRTRLVLERRRLRALEDRLAQAIRARLANEGRGCAALAARLDAMSPLKVLSRGYSLTYTSSGKLVRRASEVDLKDRVTVRTSEGAFVAEVVERTGSDATGV